MHVVTCVVLAFVVSASANWPPKGDSQGLERPVGESADDSRRGALIVSTTDPVADMLTRIRNAIMAGYTRVNIPASKMKTAIARILKDEGFIEDYDVTDDRPQPMIRIRLKYVGDRRNREPVLRGLKRVSKPGCRIYVKREDIPWVKSGMGIAVLSTSKGVMTDQKARRHGVGGEVLCYIW